LLYLLKENGLRTVEDGGTVKVTATDNADVLNMMDQGNIDAAIVPEPWGSILEANGAEIVLNYNQLFLDGNYPSAVVVVRNDFMKEHPEAVEEFLKVHEETTHYINHNKEEAAKIINAEINEATGKSLDVSILNNAFTKITFTTEVSEGALHTFADISKEQGFIKELPSKELVK
ncbi:MAG: ABC transporter substrate-binding protein, partial [Clostridia bacterium]|nr:ABC transporter substrate-binding protein [Clostridia bacterium]